MPAAADAGAYDLWVYGTNGFVRTFRGNSVATSAALFKPEVQVCYEPAGGRIHLKIHNTGTAGGTVTVADNAYGIGGPWTVSVAANSTGSLSWAIGTSGQWYDFTVSGTAFERRFAGRMETGQDGISDPAMGLVTSG
jgi:phospholipase C